ncbi:MAG: hypothetical protein ACXVCP_08405 [Bdellovibrio sp.]
MDYKIQIFAIELEFRLSQLLKGAGPSYLKSFQLYKRSMQEEIFFDSYEIYCERLFRFYTMPDKLRSPRTLGSILKGHITDSFYNEFILDFGNSSLDGKKILQIKEWCATRIPLMKAIPGPATHREIIYNSIESLLKYGARQRSYFLEWMEFIDIWEHECFKQYGSRLDHHFKALKQLKIDQTWNLKSDVDKDMATKRISTHQFTQTEIDWLLSLENSLTSKTTLPAYPLSRGPSKKDLVELNNLVRSVSHSAVTDLNIYRDQIANVLNELLKVVKMSA